MRSNSQRGVTLVELLIAITLVAALATGMLMALRSSLTAMDRINVRLEENRRVVGLQQIVNRQISGTIPGGGNCRFIGMPGSLQLVTAYSIDQGARGFPHAVQFQVRPDPAGGVQLFETESPYAGGCGPLGAGIPPPGAPVPSAPVPGVPVAGTQTLVLATRLYSCRFSYRAPPRPDGSFLNAWADAWNLPLLPGAVRIDTVPLDSVKSNLPALAVNAPIRITKLQMDYTDDYE